MINAFPDIAALHKHRHPSALRHEADRRPGAGFASTLFALQRRTRPPPQGAMKAMWAICKDKANNGDGKTKPAFYNIIKPTRHATKHAERHMNETGFCTHFTDYAKQHNGKIFIKSHWHGKRPLADILIYVDAPQGHYSENEVGWTEIRLYFVCECKYRNTNMLHG